MSDLKLRIASGLFVLAALIVSGLDPYDRATWLMEVAPVLMAAPILLATHRRFPLTSLLFFLLCAHALVLILAEHTRMPGFHWGPGSRSSST